jgi:hypothetical protein
MLVVVARYDTPLTGNALAEMRSLYLGESPPKSLCYDDRGERSWRQARVAQWIERHRPKVGVGGSSPSAGTMNSCVTSQPLAAQAANGGFRPDHRYPAFRERSARDGHPDSG